MYISSETEVFKPTLNSQDWRRQEINCAKIVKCQKAWGKQLGDAKMNMWVGHDKEKAVKRNSEGRREQKIRGKYHSYSDGKQS